MGRDWYRDAKLGRIGPFPQFTATTPGLRLTLAVLFPTTCLVCVGLVWSVGCVATQHPASPTPLHSAGAAHNTQDTTGTPLDTCTVSPPHDCRFAVSLSCVDFIRVTYEKRKMIDRSDASHNFARLIAATLIPGLELRQPVCYQRTRRRTDEPAGPEEPAGPLVDGRHAAFLDGH